MNDYGNTWWYVRVAGTSKYGWVYHGNLNIIPWDDDGDGNYEYRACG